VTQWVTVRVALLLGAAASTATAENLPVTIVPGMTAIEFSVEQLNEVVFALDETPTVIWFFTPFCSYFGQVNSTMGRDCDAAATRLRTAFETYGEKFRWIGLSYVGGATRVNVGRYRTEHEIPFAFAVDKGGDVYASYGVRYSPTVIIVDAGKVVYREQATLEHLEETLAALIM